MSDSKKTEDKQIADALPPDPDSYDDEDCRPGPGGYPEANFEETTPAHLKALLTQKKAP